MIALHSYFPHHSQSLAKYGHMIFLLWLFLQKIKNKNKKNNEEEEEEEIFLL